MTGQCARFLEVVAGLNIVTAGATQAGKTTLLSVRQPQQCVLGTYA